MLFKLRVAVANARKANRRLKKSREHRQQINEILKNQKDRIPVFALSPGGKNAAQKFLQKFSSTYAALDWHEAYAAANGLENAEYIPADLFFTVVERKLNDEAQAVPMLDKNGYDRLGVGRFPKTLARLIRKRLVGPDFRPISIEDVIGAAQGGEIVIKPSMWSGGGRDIEFRPAGELPDALKHRHVDLIVQAPIVQSIEMAGPNPSSVNTLRIATYRTAKNEIVPLSGVFRIGRAKARVDNQSAGGLAVGVSGGLLSKWAFAKTFERFDRHPDSGFVFEGHKLPGYQAAERACLLAHDTMPAVDLVSWDIAIEEDGEPTFIEFNLLNQAIDFHQLCNGPFFGKYSQEVAERVNDVPTLFGLPYYTGP